MKEEKWFLVGSHSSRAQEGEVGLSYRGCNHHHTKGSSGSLGLAGLGFMNINHGNKDEKSSPGAFQREEKGRKKKKKKNTLKKIKN